MSKIETILIAEDSTAKRNVLVHIVKKLGYNVVAAEDGQRAIEALDDILLEANWELVAIISDIMMPRKSGIDLLQVVRAHAKFHNVPFILETALADKEYIIQAKALNVNGYLLKPVTYEKLLTKLTELFPNRAFPKVAS